MKVKDLLILLQGRHPEMEVNIPDMVELIPVVKLKFKRLPNLILPESDFEGIKEIRKLYGISKGEPVEIIKELWSKKALNELQEWEG